MISTFGIVFTGAITKKYNDPRADNAHEEGHWTYATRNDDGSKCAPKPVFISTFQEQAEHCKRERVMNPREIGPVEVSSDGKKFSSVGLPGCEI
jgi:hypothetical protein